MNRQLISLVIAIILSGCDATPPSGSTTPNNLTPHPVAVSNVPISHSAVPKYPVPKLSLTNLPNPSGQWTFVTTDSSNGDTVFIDTSSAKWQGDSVLFWQRRLALVPNQNGVTTSLLYQLVDCTKGVYQFYKIVDQDSLGKMIHQTKGNSLPQNIIPGSVSGDVSQFICRQASQSAEQISSEAIAHQQL